MSRIRKSTGFVSAILICASQKRRTPIYSIRASGRPLHFGYDVVGQRAIADRLLQANSADWDSHSRSDIMTQYYRLKSAGQLDHFTLIQAVILARELIQATIDLAAQSAGVGGPIDIATLTKTGFHCIQRKSRFAAFPSPKVKVTDSTFGSSPVDLDNLQCIHCDFTDSHLLFTGTADVQLMYTTFGGRCRLAISPDAYRRRPEAVDALQKLVGSKCKQVVQGSNYP